MDILRTVFWACSARETAEASLAKRGEMMAAIRLGAFPVVTLNVKVCGTVACGRVW
jgi:hypothetical protein